MKKILLIIPFIFFFNCKTDCDADCSGFDFNLAIYDWYLFPTDEQELKFYDIENNSITLQRTSNSITEPRIIEHNCSNIFTPNDCNERISSDYEANENNQIEINNEILDLEEDSFDDDYIKTGSEIVLDSNYRIYVGFYYNNDQIEYKTNDEYDFPTINLSVLNDIVLNDKLLQDIIEITVTDSFLESFNYDGITKIWIQKNNGLVAFEFNGTIWSKEI